MELILPLIEGHRPLLGQHGQSTVQGTAVLAMGRVHVSCFHNINWGSNHGGAETSTKCRREVAWKVICEK